MNKWSEYVFFGDLNQLNSEYILICDFSEAMSQIPFSDESGVSELKLIILFCDFLEAENNWSKMNE